MFYCHPPGNTDPEHLFNLGKQGIVENNFVYFHDQEPVHLDLHQDLFQEVVLRNFDVTLKRSKQRWINFADKKHSDEFFQHTLDHPFQYDTYFRQNQDIFLDVLRLNPDIFNLGHVVVSERGENVEQLESMYGWKSHYYFFHGWACQDWFRGYDKSYLISRAECRRPRHTFMSPNRIIGGKRDHRVLFLYHVFKNKLDRNYISAPRICAYENVDIITVANKYCSTYPDIEQVFAQAQLPRLFTGEQTQQMTSCWLSNFDEAMDSLVYVPTETVYFGRRTHLTEKTFKAIALEMPFILMAPAGSLEYLREYGFQTFHDIWDESYDQETDDIKRVEKVIDVLTQLENLSVPERQQIHRACLPRVQHNFNHFYRGTFTSVLEKELENMLNGLKIQFRS